MVVIFSTGCAAQGANTDPFGNRLISVIINQGADALSGRRPIDGQRIRDSIAYGGASVANTEVDQAYRERAIARDREQYNERAYEEWAREQDRQQGRNTTEDLYRKRYADEVRRGIR